MKPNTIENPLKVTAVVVLATIIAGLYLNLDWLAYAGITMLGVGLVSSRVNQTFARLWMAFARVIGTVNSKLLLTIIFYLVLTPIAVLYRLLRGSPLQTIEETNQDHSYFIEREETYSASDFENPW